MPLSVVDGRTELEGGVSIGRSLLVLVEELDGVAYLRQELVFARVRVEAEEEGVGALLRPQRGHYAEVFGETEREEVSGGYGQDSLFGDLVSDVRLAIFSRSLVTHPSRLDHAQRLFRHAHRLQQAAPRRGCMPVDPRPYESVQYEAQTLGPVHSGERLLSDVRANRATPA